MQEQLGRVHGYTLRNFEDFLSISKMEQAKKHKIIWVIMQSLQIILNFEFCYSCVPRVTVLARRKQTKDLQQSCEWRTQVGIRVTLLAQTHELLLLQLSMSTLWLELTVWCGPREVRPGVKLGLWFYSQAGRGLDPWGARDWKFWDVPLVSHSHLTSLDGAVSIRGSMGSDFQLEEVQRHPG